MTGMYVASNPTALSSQFQLTRNMGALSETLTRLSTGLKINSGKDDPAGLIASELLKAQITGTSKAITNTQRANALIATADSSLAQIGNLLNDIKGLTVEAANTGTMTDAQLFANQLQVDAALDSIDRIARTAQYGGKKILDGSLDFRTAGMGGGISNVNITSANFGTASAVDVNVNVQQAADYARLISNGTGVAVDTAFDIVGNRGSATISVGAGSSNDTIASLINKYTDSTGVIAYVEGQAQRGSIVLSSAGGNNDIIVTALENGLDAGNYEFRITQGYENDARVVQEAKDGKPGIIEISLKAGSEARYTNFADMFDIAIDTTNGNVDTAINMTRGTSNLVTYAAEDKSAATNVINGKSIVADVSGNAITSALNGWTVAVDNSIVKDGKGHEVADLNTKTVYISTTSERADIEKILGNALSKTDPKVSGIADPTVTVNAIGIGSGYANGDRFTFAGGASAGEVNITYAEGATAGDILKLLNNAPNVQATLKNGVNADALIKNIPDGLTSMSGNASVESRYTSSATAAEVIDLINSKLGDKFIATGLATDGGTGGRVSYMDAAVDYGDINLGNAVRFTGMDNGPVVRLTNLGSNGQQVANQKLSVSIIHPSEADIKAGLHTPILEIKLATDSQGNSITTAKDLADFFNKLTPEQTMGVSVAQLYPPGVDPNGRIFGVDECGKPIVLDTCATPVNGIVQPTGAPGVCGPNQGDLILLGGNQRIVEDNAVARVNGNNRPGDVPAAATIWTEPGDAADDLVRFEASLSGEVFTFGAADAKALEGLTLEIVDGTAPPHATFSGDGGVLTLTGNWAGMTDGVDTAAEIADLLGAIFNGDGGADIFTGPGGDTFRGLFLAINEYREAEGLDKIASSYVFNEEGDFAVSDTLDDGDEIVIKAEEALSTPIMEFSREDAEKLLGVNFTFTSSPTGVGVPADPTFAGGTITIDLEQGVDDVDDDTFLAAVNAALAWLADNHAGFQALGFEDAASAPVALDVEGFHSATIGGATTVVPTELDLPYTVTTNAVSAAVQGGVSTITIPATEGHYEDDPGAPPTPATAGTVTITGLVSTDYDFTFAFDDTGNLGPITLAFIDTGTTAWSGTTLTIALDDTLGQAFTAVGDGDSAAAFEAYLNVVINAALGEPGAPTGVTGITVSHVDTGTPTSPWTNITNSAGIAAEFGTITIPAGTEASPGGETWVPGEDAYDIEAYGQTILKFDNTSAMNGMTFGFTRDETKEGFDPNSGTLIIFLDSHFTNATSDDDLRIVVNDAIHANWEAIRAFTGATGDAVKLAADQQKPDPGATPPVESGFSVKNALIDAAAADRPGATAADGKTMISGSFVEGPITGERGVGPADSVLNITANAKGTQMAGVNIHFVNDTQGGLKEWLGADDGDGGYINGAGAYNIDQLPDIKVEFKEYEDGSKELIITANLGEGTASELNAGLLAAALNANADFNKYFSADARQYAEGPEAGQGLAGSVLFNTDISKPSAQTVGGYRVESAITGGGKQATSSGIGMTGQTDANERLVIESEELGSGQYLAVNMITGQLDLVDEWGYSSNYAQGSDMVATINGMKATAQGNNISINTSDLAVSMTVGNAPGWTGFTITGGGALFQLGPDVVSQQQIRVGIGSMMTSQLGGNSGKMYMLKSGNIAALNSDDGGRKLADRIVNEAIEYVASTRGRLGALQKGTLEPNIDALQDSMVALTEANAMITNADFAVESSNLMRLQLLIQAGAQTLGIANQLPQYAASLVR